MQPSFIPFNPHPVWFYVIISILIGGMFVLDLLMKKWSFWQNNIALWIKGNQLGEGGRDLLRKYQNGVIYYLYRRTALDDLESLRTRAL
jgi:hypothetical protein